MGEDSAKPAEDEVVDAAAPGKGTVLLQDENNVELEHETEHSDDVSVDVDVKKTTGSQKRLWFLVILAVMLMAAGGYGFYTQLESGTASISNNPDASPIVDESNQTEEVDESLKGEYVYTISSNGTELSAQKIGEGEVSNSVTIAKSGQVSRSPSVQVSSNGNTVATATNNSISIKRGDSDAVSFLSTADINNLDSWVLIPDGTKVFALVGSDLHKYDVNIGQASKIDGFSPEGANKSELVYSRDGTIRQYSKSDTTIAGAIYSVNSEEIESLERNVTRLPRVGDFQPNSVSPDNNSIVFIAELNGVQTLQLLSLNSFVIRTVYIAETPGTAPVAFSWSQDSNNIVISVSGASSELVNLKVGTLQKETIASGSKEYQDPKWSPKKSHISFVQDGRLQLVSLESKEINQGPPAQDITGWYQK